jgi:Family of unknown function (DUF5686)/CarboxypepD_reg-like domain
LQNQIYKMKIISLKTTLLFCSFFIIINCFAIDIKGIITSSNNSPLPYASIVIKGTAIGTTANSKGEFSINVATGKHTLVCRHIGYKTAEKAIDVGTEMQVINFVLIDQSYTFQDVVVKSGGEDPAYQIIKKTIAKREEHLNEIKKFECDVYLKGQFQLRNYPKKFMGNAVDFEDGDTSKKKIIFLSETIAKYSKDGNNKKIEVSSTRVSGSSDGYGFSNPQIVSFYDNIIKMPKSFNPRGFISPIANNALQFYTYKFMGTFYENGKEISKIKITPKRSYEPLFNGFINILEDDYRLHSLEVTLLKNQQLQLLDTLKIEQIYVPLNKYWVIKQQIIEPAGKIFAFDFFGAMVQVYSNFNTNPTFAKGYFNNVILKFEDSANKKKYAFWDSARPIPLLATEQKDFIKKDSLEIAHNNPQYLDSIDKKNNKINLVNLFLTGQSFDDQKTKSSINIKPLLFCVGYNTVEGLVGDFQIGYNKSYTKRKHLTILGNLRYGFGNTHFNPSFSIAKSFGKNYYNAISLKAGSEVLQIDNRTQITMLDNTIATLSYSRNYMKIYEAKFAQLLYEKDFGKGIKLVTGFEFQNRLPLENTSNYKWRNYENRAFTPNYISASNFAAHNAFTFVAQATYTPQTNYIEYPDRTVNIGSKYPTFTATYKQGIENVLGSNVNYSKWRLMINDDLNLKLAGVVKYNVSAGGFFNADKVYAPDYNHFLGNQVATATEYLNGFQNMPYYSFSNTSKLYAKAHIEYHLNGLLTNKIPGFKKLNWFLVLGANALYLNEGERNYFETFVSIENILKVLRLDIVKSYDNKQFEGIWTMRLFVPFLGK